MSLLLLFNNKKFFCSQLGKKKIPVVEVLVTVVANIVVAGRTPQPLVASRKDLT